MKRIFNLGTYRYKAFVSIVSIAHLTSSQIVINSVWKL